ncbi:hypothetical protein VG1_CDS0041 [Arthrobacter phage Cupello]|nr:hypothetical protein VG1_CDS0041 [Arthrobacter phage Cupello]
MTAEDVAEVLRASSVKTVARYRKEGKLRAIKVGRGYRFDPRDVSDFVEELRAEAKQEQFWARDPRTG